MAEPRWYDADVSVPLVPQIAGVADTLNSVIEFLINVANVALATLEVVKSLLVGLLNPIRAIIETIIAEIEAFLNDLRQLGLYITWDDIVYPFDGLVGGFGPYQARMLGRLTNRNDPTRPNFSTYSAVAGVFVYASANPSSIYALVDLIRLILRLFGINVRDRGFPTPVGLTVSYGGSDIAAFTDIGKVLRGGDVPDVAKVRWSIAVPSTVVGPVPLLPAPPKFLIEVSVVPDGFGVAYNLPTPNSNLNQQTFGVLMTPDGVPLRVYGGSTLGLSDSLQSSFPTPTTPTLPGVASDLKLKANNVTVYAYRNSADTYPIPLSAITGPVAGKHLFQRTFVYDVVSLLGINLLSPGQPFSFRLRAEDMPYNATLSLGPDGTVQVTPDDEPAREVYVRVRSVGSGFAADADRNLTTPIYTINESTFYGTGTVIPATASYGEDGGFGLPSDPVKVTFPDDQTVDYLETVTTAIVLLVLSRSDLRALVEDPADAATVRGIVASGGEISAVLQGDTLQLSDFSPSLAKVLTTRDVKEVGLCPTGLEAVAAKVVPLFGAMATGGKVATGGKPDAKSLYGKEGSNQLVFRRKVVDRCRRLAENLLERGGPPTADMLETVESLSEVFGTVPSEDGETTTVTRTPLRRLRWGQVFPEVANTTLGRRTILEGLTDPETYYTDEVGSVGIVSSVVVSGVAPNPLSVEDVRPDNLRLMYFGSWESVSNITAGSDTVVETVEPTTPNRVLLRRSPGFLLPVGANGTVPASIGQGSADMSPVVYVGQTPMWKSVYGSSYPPRVVFIRNGVVRFPELATAIANVLNVSTGPMVSGKPTGAWIAIRLFPQGLTPVDELLQKISDFLRTVLDGLQGIIDVIVAYIEFLQARILELEALLRRIQALIDLILALDIGAGVYALPIVEDGGTDALVRGLMGATDAPPSTPNDLGFGLAIVAGGLPGPLLELITLFFPPKEG